GLSRVIGGELVVAVEDRLLLGDALHDVVANTELGVELRLLLEIADTSALGGPGLATIFLVDAGHDLEQGRLARAVDAEHADLGVRVEAQVLDIEQFPGGIALDHILHEIDVLTGHCAAWKTLRFEEICWRPCSGASRKGQPPAILRERVCHPFTTDEYVRRITTIETIF